MSLTERERELLADAVSFYLDRVTFCTGDEAETQYHELLDRLTN